MEVAFLYRRYTYNEWCFFLLLVLFGLSMMASALWEPLRYVKYGLPFVTLFLLWVTQARLVINRTLIRQSGWFTYLGRLFLFYCLAFALNAIVGFRFPRFYLEVFFALSPLLFALMVLMLEPEAPLIQVTHLLFAGVLLAFLLEKNTLLVAALLHPSQVLAGLASSELESESNLAFQFGMIVIVYAHHRKWLMMIIAAILLILAFKRIAILGVVLVGLLYLVKKMTNGWINPAKGKWLIIASNLAMVSVLFLFFMGNFDDLVFDIFGVSPNFLTVGRYDVYTEIFRHFGGVKFWGFGLGAINTFLAGANYELVNLHSDVLKIFFELGPIAYLFWILLFHSWPRHMLVASLAIYMNVLFMTDNTFIYFDVLFCYYLLSGYGAQQKTETA